MKTTEHIAKHLEEVYFGKNWTASNLQDQLSDITWEEACTAVDDINTIATLVNHIHYYIRVATKVLEGGPLEGKDEESFAHEVIASQEDWNTFVSIRYEEARHFIELIRTLDDSILNDLFADEKYGSYFRNLQGIVEHTHYHLGQIAILKKIIRTQNTF